MTLAMPPDQDIVIIGATGDLSRRKLLPALYNLAVHGELPAKGKIIGLARRGISDEEFRERAREAVAEFSRSGIDDHAWGDFAERLSFLQLDGKAFQQLAGQASQEARLIYLAIPPAATVPIVKGLGEHGLGAGARLVLEKPFGLDLASARELSQALFGVADESRIFRIDHYLAKETVQNILVFRFANAMFERVWNRDAVEDVQITVAESIGVEDRGAFYDEVGALRDVLQNHVLQMLALMMMEPPVSFDAESIRDEKTKVLRAVRPVAPGDVIRGQYTAGRIEGGEVSGYRQEAGVRPDSRTETFVAMHLSIDNWRWAGVPICVRTGKRLSQRTTQVEIAFKYAPAACFEGTGVSFLHPNHLTLSIQPEERIQLEFLTKVPGPEMALKQVPMSFAYAESFATPAPEAYERLLHDAMVGDQTLFVREDSVEQAWAIVEPVLRSPPPLYFYPAGSWGPEEADGLVAPNRWQLH